MIEELSVKMKSVRLFFGFYFIFMTFNLILCNESDIDRTWGSVNDNSIRINSPNAFTKNTAEGTIAAFNYTYIVPKIIHGIRLRSFNNSGAVGDIIEGGIGYNFTIFKLVGHSNYMSFVMEGFENNTNPTTTPASSTLEPDRVVLEKGNTDEETKLIEKRFQNYPLPGETAEVNTTLQVPGNILGLRLTSLNNTNGLWEELGGGINNDYVTFIFKGSDVGEPYDFNLQIFGNSSVTLKISVFIVILSSVFMYFI
ncbi:unnamed protein product [Chironomus riparius]|uniref:Uncharacterized protein n=1 Tax=Chironomus riparius TaxID=315576 RepID=A0A9N9WN19_9DIPT|nr:unnamed protein product [Chironomus riparius]